MMHELILARILTTNINTQTILIIFVEIVIVIIYLVSLLLVIIRRAKKLLELYNRRYYYIIIFYIITKLILCAILIIQIIVGIADQWVEINPQKVEIMIKIGIILADLSMIELFLVALESYLGNCFSVLNDALSKKTSKCLMLTLKCLQIFTFFVLVILLVVHDLGYLGYNILNGITLGMNMIIVISFLITFFYLNFKMTGIMMEKKLNEVIKRIYKVQLIILVSRAISMTFQIIIGIYIMPDTFQSFVDNFSQNIQYEVVLGILFVGSVVFVLMTEGLPVMYSLRSSVIESLNYNAKKNHNGQSMFTDISSDLQQSLVEQNHQDDDTESSMAGKEIKMRDFTNLEEAMGSKQDSIWLCKKGKYEGKDYLIRISKHEISSYIFQDIENQLSFINQSNIASLSKIHYFSEGQIIHLVQNLYVKKIDDFVVQNESENECLKVSLRIAEAIRSLHDKELAHGCITPNHIFCSRNQIILNGFGLHSLKKYLSLITGYSNKSIYTAIEHLKDKNNIILKPKKSADVYSFGIIFYEIITKNRQYRQLPLKEVHAKFVDENFRPKLPEYIKFQVKNLIRKCWNETPQKRPTISQVIDNIKKLV